VAGQLASLLLVTPTWCPPSHSHQTDKQSFPAQVIRCFAFGMLQLIKPLNFPSGTPTGSHHSLSLQMVDKLCLRLWTTLFVFGICELAFPSDRHRNVPSTELVSLHSHRMEVNSQQSHPMETSPLGYGELQPSHIVPQGLHQQDTFYHFFIGWETSYNLLH
jgi:hypothetical protein